MINRIHTRLLEEYLYLYPLVFLSGPRQAGKSALLNVVLADYEKPYLLLDLERDEDADKLRIPEKFFEDKKDCLLVIDDIQRMPSLYAHIQHILLKPGTGLRFLIAGSGIAPMLRLCEELGSKRAVHMPLRPFNCLETGEIADPLTHWLAGGFQTPLQMQDPGLRPVWYASYLRGLAERDLPLAGLKEHPEMVRRVLPFLAEATGDELNKAEITRELGIRPEILNHILTCLVDIGILWQLNSFPGLSGKRVVLSPRYFFADTGLLHYLLGIRTTEQLLVSSYRDASWANQVINQVAACNFPPMNIRYYQTHDGAGCELVVFKGKKPAFCLSAQTGEEPVIRRAFTTAIRDMGTAQNIIILPGRQADTPLRHNIRSCDLATACKRIDAFRLVYARKVYVPRKLKEEEGFGL